jgi:diguanylate cyclase (GGDEF)-like protein
MILLVEDSPILRHTITRALYREVDIATANDGEEAWDAISALPEIDLVVTELEMPLLDGHGLLARIRASDSPRHKAMPVIVLSEADQPEARRRALACGADDYLIKPVDPAELLARVNLHQRLSAAVRESEECRRTIDAQTTLDSVTGLYNRRAFFEHTRRGLSSAVRHQTTLSLLLLDLDHYAAIHDHWGDEEGDHFLAEIGAWLAKTTREEDTVARLEDARFAILAPQAGELAAAVLAERLRSGIAELAFPIDGQVVQTTVSIGVASLHRESATTAEALITTAKRRVAMARSRGRNQVCRRDEPSPTVEGSQAESLTEPVPPAVRRSAPEAPDSPGGDLVAQLVPLLRELTRQLGVEQLTADQGKPGPTSPP